MTLIEPEIAESESSGRIGNEPAPVRLLVAPVMTTDARQVGRLFVIVSLLFGLATAVLGVLLSFARTDAATPADMFGGLNSYFRLWTLYRVSFVLLVVMPLLMGIALAVVPSQIGASNVAFPRAALASFWTWLIGAVIVVSSALAGGGWGAIDGVTANERDAMALTLLGTALVLAALVLAAVNVAATVISLRPLGMSLLEVPPLAWSMLVASVVWLLSLPAAVANIVIVYADLRGRSAIAFGRAEGPDIWLQLDWLVEQPAVYAMAVPVLGIVFAAASGALSARSSRPEVAAAVIGLFGLLAVGGWSQDYFTAPQDLRDGLLYVAFGLAAVVPIVATAGGVGELALRGTRTPERLFSVEMLSAGAALKLLGAAALVGALRVIEPFDLLESAATWAVFHGVVAAGLLAAVAGLHLWAPLPLRRGAANRGRGSVVLIGAGGSLLVLSDLIAAFVSDDADLMALTLDTGLLNVVNLVGAVLVAAGVAVTVATLSASRSAAR